MDGCSGEGAEQAHHDPEAQDRLSRQGREQQRSEGGGGHLQKAQKRRNQAGFAAERLQGERRAERVDQRHAHQEGADAYGHARETRGEAGGDEGQAGQQADQDRRSADGCGAEPTGEARGEAAADEDDDDGPEVLSARANFLEEKRLSERKATVDGAAVEGEPDQQQEQHKHNAHAGHKHVGFNDDVRTIPNVAYSEEEEEEDSPPPP